MIPITAFEVTPSKLCMLDTYREASRLRLPSRRELLRSRLLSRKSPMISEHVCLLSRLETRKYLGRSDSQTTAAQFGLVPIFRLPANCFSQDQDQRSRHPDEGAEFRYLQATHYRSSACSSSINSLLHIALGPLCGSLLSARTPDLFSPSLHQQLPFSASLASILRITVQLKASGVVSQEGKREASALDGLAEFRRYGGQWRPCGRRRWC